MQIEKWTREQCEEYLKQYPKSLNSEAVRKRLAFLTPEAPSPEQKKSEQNAADLVEFVKTAKKGEQSGSATSKPQSTSKTQTNSAQRPKPNTGSTYVDPHEKDMAVVGKAVLTILVLVLCFGIVMLCVELLGGESAIYTGPVCAGVAIPLANKIWKK
jgi:hypothetical protein